MRSIEEIRAAAERMAESLEKDLKEMESTFTCPCSPPAKGIIEHEEGGKIVHTEKVGDWSETCSNCGKPWSEHK